MVQQKSFGSDQNDQPHVAKPRTLNDLPTVSSDTVVSPPDKFIGTIIDDRYEIVEAAGKGGMSAVYRAVHLLTSKTVALKLMHSHLLTDDNAVRRFQQEAKAASRLHHPNAISVQDMGVTEDGQPYLTMDFLEGRSLSEELKSQYKLAPERALRVFEQVCSALAHAHDQRIIHRDLKPSNVMLIEQSGDPDFVKVVDFGIAKIMMDGGESLKLTATGDVLGSPLYMSPEQCMGNRLDPRSDIYSMGVLMYETLTGQVPHEGKNVLETMHKHTNIAAPTLTNVDADPRTLFALDQILQKCLAKLPEQRYQSMVELRDELAKVSIADKKGLKLAAQLGMEAADKGRQIDNRVASISSRKIFWIAVPLLVVLTGVVGASAYYWINTAGDPKPTDRILTLNRDFHSPTASDKKQTDAMSSSGDESLDSGKSEDQHNALLGLFHQKLRDKNPTRIDEYYHDMRRLGFYLQRKHDYDVAKKAFEEAMATSKQYGFSNEKENSMMRAAIADCLLEMTNEAGATVDTASRQVEAYKQAKEAEDYYDNNHESDDANMFTTNVGNLLELSKSPERMQDGIRYVQALLQSQSPSAVANGIAFAQAAQFAEACALQGASIPIPVRDPIKQITVLNAVPAREVQRMCLERSLEAWQMIGRKRAKEVALYNQGVIHNRLGLLAQQLGDFDNAEKYFKEACKELAIASTPNDESVAKVLFNLSDVQMKQRNFLGAAQSHSEAKRIWDDTFHADKQSSRSI